MSRSNKFVKFDSKGKKPEVFLGEFVRKIGTDLIRDLHYKLTNRGPGEFSDCAEIFQEHSDVDRWLRQSSGAMDWFYKVDLIREYLRAEMDRKDIDDLRLNIFARPE